jgi:hypothetical protein
MKTAACWFGDKWTVRTKYLGEPLGHEVVIEVEKVANGNAVPDYSKFDAPRGEHYTEVRIERMHMKLQGRRLGKTRESLRSMYRVDIRAGILDLTWDSTRLPWLDELNFLTDDSGNPERLAIEFDVADRRVTGWVGVLAPGSSSRGNAGFALIRRGRLIRGWPDGWRPEAIFGPSPGRNDLINQRLTGELHLDEFDVTHTKDDILWRDDEEEAVQNGIKSRIADLLKSAREFRHPTVPKPPKSKKLAMESAIQDTDLIGRLRNATSQAHVLASKIVPPDIADAATTVFTSRFASEPASATLSLNGTTMKVLSASGLDEDAPYMSAQRATDDSWLVALNPMHAMCALAEDDEVALRVHIQHAVADALVIWAVKTDRVSSDPFSMLFLKDAMLRAMTGKTDG